MKERIYTIPVNEAFESTAQACPFCLLYEKLESNELDIILGPSLMEPDIRIITNKKGFCKPHYTQMMTRNSRLGLALMIESHLAQQKKELKAGGFFSRDKGSRPQKGIKKLENSCYICDRIEEHFDKMFQTAVYLYDETKDFRTKFNNASFFCLTHYAKLLDIAQGIIPKDRYNDLAAEANKLVLAYMDTLSEDLQLYIKKFDYRFDDLPWGNSKNSIERTIKFLKGSENI